MCKKTYPIFKTIQGITIIPEFEVYESLTVIKYMLWKQLANLKR